MIIKNEKKKNTCFYISCFAFVSTPVLRSLFFFGIKSRNNLIKTEEEKKRKERTGAERCRKHFQSLGGGCGGCFADVKWQTRSRCVAGHIPAPYTSGMRRETNDNKATGWDCRHVWELLFAFTSPPVRPADGVCRTGETKRQREPERADKRPPVTYCRPDRKLNLKKTGVESFLKK